MTNTVATFEPERDRWGRYMLPHPETGRRQAWTRATTWASSIADTFGLTKWQLRMAAVGLGQRPDLLAQVCAAGDAESKEAKSRLDKLVDQAKEHAGSSTRANLGSALHAFAEQVDAGGDIGDVPNQWRPNIAAYRQAMDAADIKIDPTHVERIVCVPELGVAGTFDRLCSRSNNGVLVVGDLKTGRDLSYSWTEIAVQLAIYAHARHMWTGTDWELMPSVDQERALVMHLPAGEAHCTLYHVDIEAGWDTATRLCGPVREWRKRKGLATTLVEASSQTGGEAHTVPHSDRTEWVRGRINALADDDRAKRLLAQHWPPDVQTQPPWTDSHIDAIAETLTNVEAATGQPFPGPDPANTPAPRPAPEPASVEPTLPQPDNGGPAPPPHFFFGHRSTALPPERLTAAHRWMAEARRAHRPWPPVSTKRGLAVQGAALTCLESLWDDDEPDTLVRAALSMVYGDDAAIPKWETGPLIGALTTDEAEYLEQIASAYPVDVDVAAELGRRAAAV